MRNCSVLLLLLLLQAPMAIAQPQTTTPTPRTDKIGIALSGGAARGFAHIGVLQALEDYGIVPDYVAGTSMGAVIGAVYAAGMTPSAIYDYGRKQQYFRIFKPALFTSGSLSKSTFIYNMLNGAIPYNSFDSLQKKLFVSVTNLNTTENVIVSSGHQLKEYVVASASIPLMFEPMVIDSTTYVDGGLTNNLPANALVGIPDCKHIIGVTVHPVQYKNQSQLHQLGVMSRVMSMVVISTEMETRKQCEHLLIVDEAADLGLLDFNRIDDFYRMGYEAAVAYVKAHPEILQLSNAHLQPQPSINAH